jgi:hypothetical protein
MRVQDIQNISTDVVAASPVLTIPWWVPYLSEWGQFIGIMLALVIALLRIWQLIRNKKGGE